MSARRPPWVMDAHGNWSCGPWRASRFISGGWELSLNGEPGRIYRSLAECQRVVKQLHG